MSDKVNEIVKRWMLIEDQLSSLEYHMLNELPVDGTDIEYASRFASVRSKLGTIRVHYEAAKSSRHPEFISGSADNGNDAADSKQIPDAGEYELGAPRFPYDDFLPNK